MAAYATAPSLTNLEVSQAVVVEPLGRPPIARIEAAPIPFIREDRIAPADTFGTLSRKLGISDPAAYQFVLGDPLAQKIFEELRPGKVVTASTMADGRLVKLTFPLNDQVNSIVVENRAGQFFASKQPLMLEYRTLMRSSEIRSSFFAAADTIDLPDSVTTQMADIFGGEIDFHRSLRRGDRFSVVYEMAYLHGRPARAGRILAAEFINDGQAHRAVWFNDGSTNGSYYTPEGRSLKTAFLRSPIEFSRISSGFSMRLHPILQTWRAHRGVDYAAPIGTPVRSTADGIVEEVGRQGGYGNTVVLRHGAQYTTLYGHLDGFAHGVRRGAAVKQGQIIGYVGRTGWATGPHLHYEFRINDVQQDPLKVAMPTGGALSAAQLAAFRQQALSYSTTLDKLRLINLAQLD
jgi:murein DD-endopeptidase MepM/ murein hydrolase activator NlpD